MPSFFEKLKKGMGIEEPLGKEVKGPEKPEAVLTTEKDALESPSKTKRKKRLARPKKLEIKTISLESTPEKAKEGIAAKEESPTEDETQGEKVKEKWFDSEGQLAIDVFQTENELVIQSAIAGVQQDDLDVIIEKDIITIKGTRQNPCGEECDYFSQECFWGPFSREVILPVEVDPNRAAATMKNGVLIIKLPKILREKQRKIIVKETS